MFTTRCGKSRQPRHFARRPSGRAAFLEALESRVLLSGTVAVTVVGKNLFVTGDDLNNDIVITGSDGSYAVNSGTDTTTITGGSVTNITGKVVIALKGGNDTVTFNGATFGNLLSHTTCPVNIDGGAGDNIVVLATTSIFGTLTVANADGFDVLNTSGDSLVSGAITVNNGAGGSMMTFGDGFVAGANVSLTTGAQTTSSTTSFSSITIAGNLSVNNGNGTATTVLSSTHVGGKTTIVDSVGAMETVVVGGCTLGKALTIAAKGANNVQIVSSKIGGDVTFTADATTGAAATVILVSSTVSGNVNCTVGSAKASAPLFDSTNVTINGSSLFKNYTLNAAGQTNILSVSAVQLAGATKVSYATGSNTANITNVALGGNVTFTSAGTGHDALTMSGAIGGNLSVTSGNTAVDGDSLTVNALTVTGNLSAKTGAGADVITGSDLVVDGTTSLQIGDGNNNVQIDDCQFVGALSLVGGNGKNVISIETQNASDGPLTDFLAAVSLKLGNGNNTVTVGEAAVAGHKALFLGPLALVGGTGTNHLTIANLTLLQFPSLKGFSII